MDVSPINADRFNFQYITSDGFWIESASDIIPIFDRESASMVWRERSDFVIGNPFSDPSLVRLLQDEPRDETLQDGAFAFTADFLSHNSEDVQWTSLGVSLYDSPTATYFVTASWIVHEHLRRAQKFYNRRLSRVIKHIQTMNGRAVLVAKSTFESILAVVRDHIFPSEFISLSREHSQLNLCADRRWHREIERERFSAWRSMILCRYCKMSPHSWYSCARFGRLLSQPN